MKIIILTGNETRHEFFRKKLAADDRISVLCTYCEGSEKSLENRILSNSKISKLELMHVKARTQSEKDFFDISIRSLKDHSNPRFVAKGAINDEEIVRDIINQKPDLLVCYGSSLINSELLEKFKGRFLNVHLGLSPYYRGSGTNIWPLINGEPDMVGATFMYIDPGIDTGEIIHQIRADFFLGDSPHSIGNRLIAKMTATYAKLIVNFNDLKKELQPEADGKLYMQKDFDQKACRRLYQSLHDGMIERYLSSSNNKNYPYIVRNKGIEK